MLVLQSKIPIYPLTEWAKILTFGAKKYSDRNWEKGFAWSRAYGAVQRHLTSFWDGEDLDPETQLSHLAHAICEITFLLEFSSFSSLPLSSILSTVVCDFRLN